MGVPGPVCVRRSFCSFLSIFPRRTLSRWGQLRVHFVNPMRLSRYCLIAFLLATPAFSQLTTKSPVDEFKDQVTQALKDANVPFTPDQEKELALLIEEERQASENLFGVIWNF